MFGNHGIGHLFFLDNLVGAPFPFFKEGTPFLKGLFLEGFGSFATEEDVIGRICFHTVRPQGVLRICPKRKGFGQKTFLAPKIEGFRWGGHLGKEEAAGV